MKFRVALGIGGTLSPLFGATCYTLGGFLCCFLTIGITFLCLSPYIYYKLCHYQKEWAILEEQRIIPVSHEHLSRSFEKSNQFSLGTLVKYMQFNFGFCSQIVATAGSLGFSSIIVPYMDDVYQLDANKSSLCLLMTAPGFIVGGIVSVRLYNGRILPRRTLLNIGLVLQGISTIFVTGNV